MPERTHLLQIRRQRQRRRNADRPAQRRSSLRLRLGLSTSALLSLLLALTAFAGVLSYASLVRDLPSVEALPALLEPPAGLYLQPTRLYDRSGAHVLLTLQSPLTAEARYLSYDPTFSGPPAELLPAALITATLAAADPGFWHHPGFTLTGLRNGAHTTLAQQLASDFLLAEEAPGLRRALRERILAAQLTDRFGRPRLLEWYLNHADYGNLAFGADAAAHLYLGKSASQLSLAEAALLAATARTPGLNPLDAPQAALENQKALLQEMLRLRLISPEAGVQAALQPLDLPDAERRLAAQPVSQAPAFTRLVLRQLQALYPRQRLERGGLNIYTTLDWDLQQQTACALKAQLARLSQTSPQSQTVSPDCAAAAGGAVRLLPTPPYAVKLPGGQLQAEAVILDPVSGAVLALEASTVHPLDFLPPHPAGTLVTPLIYLTGFTRGLSPASLVWDIPPSGSSPVVWQNPDGRYRGPLRLRLAAANDYLPPAAAVLAQVGLENFWHLTSQLGLENPAPQGGDPAPTPQSQAAPNADILRPVNLLEMARLYAVLANQGLLTGQRSLSASAESSKPASIEPAVLLRLEDSHGRLLLDLGAPLTRPILTPQVAYLINHVLSDEPARWPSLGHPNPLEIGRPAAAKISRAFTEDQFWVIGYTPQRLVGIWLGLDPAAQPLAANSETARLLQAASAGLWHALMQYASQNLPYQPWPTPAGISTLEVCDPSGDLPSADCPATVTEIFLTGNEPVQVDHMYQRLEINRETGLLATVFTPADLIQSETFLLTPPEAAEWARQAGLKPPPDSYDQIPLALPQPAGLRLDSPTMFSAVHGQVDILGSAAAEDFLAYRVQVGAGLNPRQWMLVVEDQYQPVEAGKLGTWDTRQLDGLYALQLVLIHKDQSVHRLTTLVTVDNQPPNVQILYPASGEEIPSPETARRGQNNTASVVFRLAVQDNLGVRSVEIFLDGKRLGVLVQPPYALAWQPVTGSHRLRILATDLAGNTAVAELTFRVP